MCISDWSSDVCSSDLLVVTDHAGHAEAMRAAGSSAKEADADHIMHLALSDPKDQNSPRHIRTFGRTEDLVKGELLLDKETETNTRSEEHTSELQSLMRISYAVFCLKKKKNSRTSAANNTRNQPQVSTSIYTSHTHSN